VATKVVDEDTADVIDVRVRLALVNTAEKEETKYTEQKNLLKVFVVLGPKLWLMRMTGNQTEVITEWLALFIVGSGGEQNIIIKSAITPKRLRKNTRTILRR
jgi:hypothetical protein